MGANRRLRRLALHDHERERALRPPLRVEDRSRERRGETPLEQALQKIVQERDDLRDQLDVVRDLADRMMTLSEAGQARISDLERQLAEKDALVAALEEENGVLISQVSRHAERVSQLEATLTMLAEADS